MASGAQDLIPMLFVARATTNTERTN